MTNFMKNFTEVTAQESFKKFGYGEMADLVIHFFDRFEEEEIKKDIENNDDTHFNNCFNDEFIYYDDLWLIMKYYQRPQDANFNEAINLFYEDLYEIYTSI